VKTLADPREAADIRRRLGRIRPDSTRRWGRMTAHQMICHLRDAFLIATDPSRTSQLTGIHHRTIVKWIALYVPVRWPAGIVTRPEIDQALGSGSRPADFAADVAALEAAIEAVTSDPDAFFHGRRHPIFGPLSQAAWMRWAYLHMDHHLRQFGI
jgi:hypothetical protein